MEKYLDLIEELKIDSHPKDVVEEITRYLQEVKTIEKYLLYSIRCEDKKKRDLVLNSAFEKIAQKSTEGGKNTEKEISFLLPMLANINNELIKFGETIFDYTQNTEFQIILKNRLEPYLERSRIGIAYVGIFWVVNNKLLLHREEVAKRELKLEGKEMVDSSYSHFCKWEFYQKAYPVDDFATYPRGRIMYDVRRKEHIIYADTCVKNEQIDKIAELCNMKKYVIARDEHYRCDKCMEGKEI